MLSLGMIARCGGNGKRRLPSTLPGLLRVSDSPIISLGSTSIVTSTHRPLSLPSSPISLETTKLDLSSCSNCTDLPPSVNYHNLVVRNLGRRGFSSGCDYTYTNRTFINNDLKKSPSLSVLIDGTNIHAIGTSDTDQSTSPCFKADFKDDAIPYDVQNRFFISTLASLIKSGISPLDEATTKTVPGDQYKDLTINQINSNGENNNESKLDKKQRKEMARLIMSVLSKYVYANERIRLQQKNNEKRQKLRNMSARAISTKSTSTLPALTDDSITETETIESETKTKVSDKSNNKQEPQFQWQEQKYHPDTNTPTSSSSPSGQDEYYRYIELLQRNRQKTLRDKTSANVRRALWGNVIIAGAKATAWVSSGSSAMLSELVHSLVDCGNQALLLLGLREMGNVADRRHPYGYGKSMYFWALVSALGTFWLGAGVSMRHSIEQLINPSLGVPEITWHVWGVLGFSLVIDGWVLTRTVTGVWETMPLGTGDDTTKTIGGFYRHVKKLRDPATLAILLEDGAACLGIVMASTGIALAAATGNPVYDGLAGVGISGLLASMGLILVRLNQRFLLGQAVDPEIVEGIKKVLLKRRSIDGVHSVQSQWTGPDTFSYKAEVDFDGTFLAAKLMPRYQKEFMEAKDTLDQDLRVLLSWYAEDVMRALEGEIRSIEAEIRKEYPSATFIELEPDSKDSDKFAIDDGMEAKLRKVEVEILNRYLKSLYAGVLKPGGSSSIVKKNVAIPKDLQQKGANVSSTKRPFENNERSSGDAFGQGNSEDDRTKWENK